jgi:hypothetical protein
VSPTSSLQFLLLEKVGGLDKMAMAQNYDK